MQFFRTWKVLGWLALYIHMPCFLFRTWEVLGCLALTKPWLSSSFLRVRPLPPPALSPAHRSSCVSPVRPVRTSPRSPFAPPGVGGDLCPSGDARQRGSEVKECPMFGLISPCRCASLGRSTVDRVYRVLTLIAVKLHQLEDVGRTLLETVGNMPTFAPRSATKSPRFADLPKEQLLVKPTLPGFA